MNIVVVGQRGGSEFPQPVLAIGCYLRMSRKLIGLRFSAKPYRKFFALEISPKLAKLSVLSSFWATRLSKLPKFFKIFRCKASKGKF